MKTSWYWHKNRQVDQIKDSDINPHTYGSMIFDKPNYTEEKKKAFLTNGAGVTGLWHVEQCK